MAPGVYECTESKDLNFSLHNRGQNTCCESGLELSYTYEHCKV